MDSSDLFKKADRNIKIKKTDKYFNLFFQAPFIRSKDLRLEKEVQIAYLQIKLVTSPNQTLQTTAVTVKKQDSLIQYTLPAL
jgi:hypothetical protein